MVLILVDICCIRQQKRPIKLRTACQGNTAANRVTVERLYNYILWLQRKGQRMNDFLKRLSHRILYMIDNKTNILFKNSFNLPNVDRGPP